MKYFASICGILAGTTLALAHEDVGADKINDWITITELTATTDQDDGGGESEYCVRVTADHGRDHSLMDTEFIQCSNVDWDDPSDEAGKDWDELVPLRLPLIGTGGAMGGERTVRFHAYDCSPTSFWNLKMKLYEVNYSQVGELLNDVADLVEKEGLNAAGILGAADPAIAGLVKLGGATARLAGKWIDKIVNENEDLGGYDVVFNDGQGDPSGTIDPPAQNAGLHFRATMKKSTYKVGTCAAPKQAYYLDDTNRRRTEAGAAFLSNGTSALCLNTGDESSRQFTGLRDIALRIDAIKAEPGNTLTEASVVNVRIGMVGLVGTLAQVAAHAQISAARDKFDLAETLFSLRAPLAAADAAFEAALAEGSGELLVAAIDGYEAVHKALAPVNYGEAFEEAWIGQLEQAFRDNHALAELAFSPADPDLARGYLGEMYMVFALADAGAQDRLDPVTEQLFGVPMSGLADLPYDGAVDRLLESF